MKLSLSVPDEINLHDQSPLLKAKLPISIFNQPFTSVFTTATNSFSDLSFALSTSFTSGPSLKLAYTPSTTSSSRFSLSLKSGLGVFGSPRDSPLVFSACFLLSPTAPNAILPTFSLHFKPQLGHFALHKKTIPSGPSSDSDNNSGINPATGSHLDSVAPASSDFVNGFAPDGSMGWQEVKLEPYSGSDEKRNGLYTDNSGIGLSGGRELAWRDGKKGGIFSGIGVKARTMFPLTKSLVVNLRWGVNMPGAFAGKMPYLTVNKIGIEKVVEEAKAVEEKPGQKSNEGELELLKGMCFGMKRDLEGLEEENRAMKHGLEDMRSGVSAANLSDVGKKVKPPASVDGFGEFVQWRSKKKDGEGNERFEQWRSKKNDGEGNERREPKKPENHMNDLESQLQRAIKAASS